MGPEILLGFLDLQFIHGHQRDCLAVVRCSSLEETKDPVDLLLGEMKSFL